MNDSAFNMKMRARDVGYARDNHLKMLQKEKFGSLAAARRAYALHDMKEMLDRAEKLEAKMNSQKHSH